ETGRIEFERAVGFASSTPPFLCRSKTDAADPWGRISLAQGIRIEGLALYGNNAFGSVATGAYDCHMKDIRGAVRHILQVNGFAHCTFDGFDGTFVGSVGEFKFCAHDSKVRRITAHALDPFES